MKPLRGLRGVAERGDTTGVTGAYGGFGAGAERSTSAVTGSRHTSCYIHGSIVELTAIVTSGAATAPVATSVVRELVANPSPKYSRHLVLLPVYFVKSKRKLTPTTGDSRLSKKSHRQRKEATGSGIKLNNSIQQVECNCDIRISF